MSTLQSTYTDDPAIGYAGMVLSGATSNRITRTVEDSAGILFGKGVFRGSGDHGVVAAQTLTGAGSAAAGNVGTCTITSAPTVGYGAKLGRYVLTLLATSATGALQVSDPEGNIVAKGNIGTAITTIPGITSVTVTNGGTATAGDQFFIDVTGNPFLGFTIATSALGYIAGQDADEYQQYDNAAILTGGEIVISAAVAVNDGEPVYITSTGTLTNVASGNAPTGGWVFDRTIAAAGLVPIAKR